MRIELSEEQQEKVRQFDEPQREGESDAEYIFRKMSLAIGSFGEFLASEECKAIMRKLGRQAAKQRREYVLKALMGESNG